MVVRCSLRQRNVRVTGNAPGAQAGRDWGEPMRLRSISRAAPRPSEMAHTTSDWPRLPQPGTAQHTTLVACATRRSMHSGEIAYRQSPAAYTPSSEVANLPYAALKFERWSFSSPVRRRAVLANTWLNRNSRRVAHQAARRSPVGGPGSPSQGRRSRLRTSSPCPVAPPMVSGANGARSEAEMGDAPAPLPYSIVRHRPLSTRPLQSSRRPRCLHALGSVKRNCRRLGGGRCQSHRSHHQ